MVAAPFQTQDEMNAWVTQAKATLEQIPGDRERIDKAHQLALQLKSGMEALERNVAEMNRHEPDGNAADVVRAYVHTGASAEQLNKGAIVDLTQPATENGQRGISAVQQFAGSKGGVVRMLGGMQDGHFVHGLLDDPEPKNEWQADLQKRVEEAAWLKAFKKDTSRAQAGIVRHLQRGPKAVAKVFADNSGEGGEWIVTLPMATLERTMEMERRLEGLIRDLPVSSSSVTLPFLSTGVQPFIHGVPTSGDLNPADLSKSVPSTADRTLSVKTLSVSIPVDMDAAEDSIVDTAGLMSQLAAEGLRDGKEDALVNGDTAATHGDSGFATWNPRSRWSQLGQGNDHRKAWIGWRQRAFDVDATVTTAAQDFSATQTVSAYIGALAGLTSPHGFGDIVYITSPEHYLAKILVDTNLLTVDKYGAGATILTGEVGRIGGHPLILSEFVTADLNTSGVFDDSTKTKTGLLIVNVSRFLMARRRSLRVSVETVYRNNTTYVVASERCGLNTIDSSTTANCMWLYNLSKS